MDSETEKQRDDIHRKIGRNVVLFQRLESVLRHLLAKGNCVISFNALNAQCLSPQDQIKRQEKSVALKPMGNLRTLFSDKILTESKSLLDGVELSKGGMNIAVNISFGAAEELREKLNSIVEERNRVVHQLCTFDTNSSEGCRELELYLDQQHKKTLSVFEELKNMAENLHEMTKKSFECFSHPIVPNDCLKYPYVRELIANLHVYSVVLSKARAFGWTSLADVGRYIRQQCPDAFVECQKEYSVKPLKKILLKIGIFDVLFLPIEKGGVNVFYRLKSEFEIENDKGQLSFCKHSAHGESTYTEKVFLGISLTVEPSPGLSCSPN
jgi:hypothetical protein